MSAGELVTAADPTVIPVTILSGASLSTTVRTHGRLVGVVVPAAWTAAAITFNGMWPDSTSGGLPGTGTLVSIYDDATERTIASASIPTAESRILSLDLNDWLCIDYLQLRSGTRAAAVAQGADRTIYLILAG
jgi:hypothetical protein